MYGIELMEVEEEDQRNHHKRKTPLSLDYETLFPDDDDELPPEIIIVSHKIRPPKEEEMSSLNVETYEKMTDRDLEARIARQIYNVSNLGPRLDDKGLKLHKVLKQLEEERERRRVRHTNVVVDETENVFEGITSSDNREGLTRSTVSSKGVLATSESLFSKKMSEKTNAKAGNAFDKELSTFNPCGHNNKVKNDRGLHQKKGQNDRSSSRMRQSQLPYSRFTKGDKHISFNGDYNGRAPSIGSHQKTRLNPSSFFAKKSEDTFQAQSVKRHRKEQTVVIVDEDDEPELLDTTNPAEELDKIAEILKKKDAKIYYPSRDDPESVEISYDDMNCLGPQAFLRSPVMNFYIRYIIQQQVTPKNRGCNYHVFSTFFYKKLKEAVSYKGTDKDTFFLKFRRWWKGVNIFQKAYVLLPIHDDLHWSLVIICIPDKGEELAPIILHLDSLGLHHSQSIFNDVRSYMTAEWNYLKQDLPLELPISDKIWKCLPDAIAEKTIAVPQQKNDYDCGLFVLYFMERFIKEAPERLETEDLAMFGKQWFKPEEASGLRMKIKGILMDEFQMACFSELDSPNPVEICE